MNNDYKIYRVTLLLYFSLLVLPFGFYFSYSSLNELSRDTKALKELTLVGGMIAAQESKKDIDSLFLLLNSWVETNSNDPYYIGTKPLDEKYNALKLCYKSIGTSANKTPKECFKLSKSISFSVSNMLLLKQDKIYNMLYITFFVTLGVFVMLIFLIRAYIHNELSKKAIYDLKTKLFSKEYMLTKIKELGAMSLRNSEKLSLLYIDIECKEESSQDLKDKKIDAITKKILDSIRASDIACRYSENEFVILLPNTSMRDVENFIERIEERFIDMKKRIKVREYTQDKSDEEFLSELESK